MRCGWRCCYIRHRKQAQKHYTLKIWTPGSLGMSFFLLFSLQSSSTTPPLFAIGPHLTNMNKLQNSLCSNIIRIQGCLRASLWAHRSTVASVLILISTQISVLFFIGKISTWKILFRLIKRILHWKNGPNSPNFEGIFFPNSQIFMISSDR